MKKALGLILFSAVLSAFPAASAEGLEGAIKAEEVRELQKNNADFLLFDARSLTSFEMERIEDARLPLEPDYYQKQALYQAGVVPTPPDSDDYLSRAVENVPKNKKIITYCQRNCQASEVLMLKLKRLGFTDVRYLEDGIDAWKEKGYPVVQNSVRG